MKILKLTLPGAPTGWRAEAYMDPRDPLLREWKIVVNEPIPHASAWFVCEDLESDFESCRVPQDMVFIGASETLYESDWIISSPEVSAFYSQFHLAYTFNFFSAKKTIPSMPFLPWMIHANHGPSIFKQPDFKELLDSQVDLNSKQNRIALICSSQSLTSGHRLRRKFAGELKEYFGQQIDWFGNGINQFSTKHELYSDYRYSIVLENQSRDYVITEKLGDAFLGLTFPFYWGAPNVGHFFDADGFEVIDILDFNSTVEKIESALDSNMFDSRIASIMENRRRTLFDHNFLHRILRIVNQSIDASSSRETSITLESINTFRKRFGHSSTSLTGRIYSTLSAFDNRFQINSSALIREFQVFIMNNPLTRFRKKDEK